MNSICGDFCVRDNFGFYILVIVIIFFGDAIRQFIFGKDKDDN